MYYERKGTDIAGYQYDADVHCVGCTFVRFGNSDAGSTALRYGYLTVHGVKLDEHAIPCDPSPQDSEGNEIHPIFVSGLEGLECGNCGGAGEEILDDELEAEPCPDCDGIGYIPECCGDCGTEL